MQGDLMDAQFIGDKIGSLVQDEVDVQWLHFRRLGSGEIQQIANDLAGSFGLVHDVIQDLFDFILFHRVKLLDQGVGGQGNVIERIIDFMGNPRGKGPDRGHLLGLNQLLLFLFEGLHHLVKIIDQSGDFIGRGLGCRNDLKVSCRQVFGPLLEGGKAAENAANL